MPRKTAAKAAPGGPPLAGCCIAIGGTHAGFTAGALEKEYITPLGATLSKTVTASTSHLVTTETDYGKSSAKVKAAKSHDDIHIISLEWLQECLSQNKRVNENDYSFNDQAATATTANGDNTNGSKSYKRTATDGEDDESQSQPKKKSKATVTNGAASQSQGSVKTEAVARAIETEDGPTNNAKMKNLTIPVDETCPLTHFRVYIDDDGLIYDAALNQTNAGANANKFYRVQLLHNGMNEYRTWTRWGRVGERGQSKVLGGGSLQDAIRQFEQKFKDKSGLSWSDRGEKPRPKKYTFIEKSYTDDSDDEEAAPAKVKSEERSVSPESTLPSPVQDLMALIFNQQYFADAMADLNYDVDKLPLGKLSKGTITRGYQALKDLSILMNDPSLAQSQYGTSYNEAIEQLSNSYFSTIPHNFGRSGRLPIIQEQSRLNKEVELLDSLGMLKDGASIMKKEPKDVEKINALDRQFKGLGLNEMTPLKSDSSEFRELKNYLIETRGDTHYVSYTVDQIFRIERSGENERFDKSFAGPPRDRRLLWHGSRCTNFGGILSQGLRIAPPEAPVSGYMFGKGIYLADMSSKSANYCCSYASGGTALLLLCEAELGEPMQVLTNASYNAGEDAKEKGVLSTWGQGLTGPSQWKDAECVHPSLSGVMMPDTSVKPGHTNVNNAYLQYNEYIAYDISQIRLRYLLRVRM